MLTSKQIEIVVQDSSKSTGISGKMEKGLRVFRIITRVALRAARVKKRVGYLCRRRRVFITRDALRAARVKKRVGYFFRRRRVFIFFRRSHKW